MRGAKNRTGVVFIRTLVKDVKNLLAQEGYYKLFVDECLAIISTARREGCSEQY